MYIVLDHGKPATWVRYSRWSNSSFDTQEKARAYALDWLGPYSAEQSIEQFLAGFDYSGHGDIIQIKKV